MTRRTEFIDIVFDGPPGPDSGRFVEIENDRAEGIRFGEWMQRQDGYWVIRFSAADIGRLLEGAVGEQSPHRPSPYDPLCALCQAGICTGPDGSHGGVIGP